MEMGRGKEREKEGGIEQETKAQEALLRCLIGFAYGLWWVYNCFLRIKALLRPVSCLFNVYISK